MWLFSLVTLLVIVLDRVTKAIVTAKLALNESLPVIPDIFHLTLLYNRGAAFGILQNSTVFFVIISLLSICLILFYACFRSAEIKSLALRLSLAFILAGAFGNLIDRIKFGYVIDFLDFRIWPVFNVADSFITIGIIILIFQIFIPRKKNVPHNF